MVKQSSRVAKPESEKSIPILEAVKAFGHPALSSVTEDRTVVVAHPDKLAHEWQEIALGRYYQTRLGDPNLTTAHTQYAHDILTDKETLEDEVVAAAHQRIVDLTQHLRQFSPQTRQPLAIAASGGPMEVLVDEILPYKFHKLEKFQLY